ncbi:MAG: DUF2088 domain-containing protein [Pirellulaceae bacterium]|nr:DUF2088 domain-containing protein [Pirellulaceae bacterium]
MEPSAVELLPLRFGSQHWEIHGQRVASIQRNATPVSDLADAVDQALSQPLDFPALDQAVVSGDTVALAVDPATSASSAVIPQIARWLIEHGTEPQNLSIVLSADDSRKDAIQEGLDRLGLSGVDLHPHDPDDPQSISYVAANDAAEAIYVQRRLVDADVVIPISCARSMRTIDYLGAFGIYPLFSNRQTLGHFLNYEALSQPAQRMRLQQQADQAAWWLGILCGIQVIPAANDSVATLLCGSPAALESAAQTTLARLESAHAEATSSELVIAVVDGCQQDWPHAARALHNAAQRCSVGGSIVLCTDLRQKPGAALQRLSAGQSDPQQILSRLARDNANDALAASIVCDMARDHHVYLVSRLPRHAIENIGLAHLEQPSQLNHLIQQHERCLVIYSAQHP